MNIDSLADDILAGLDRQKKTKPRTKFVKAGKGRKHCPKCDTYIGVRTQVCDCGYKFEKGVTKKRQEAAVEPPVSDELIHYAMAIGAPGGRVVYAGTGSPSVPLTEITQEAVFDYCNLVVHEGISQGQIYTVTCIKHYLQHQFGYNTKEYKEACVFVDDWYNEKIGIDIPSGVEYNGLLH